MCDDSTWYSSSYCSSSNATITECYCEMDTTYIIPYKRKPHFRYNLKGWFNVKLAFYRYYELGLLQGIKLPRWTLRSKNSFV
jgi:hypothetical protein